MTWILLSSGLGVAGLVVLAFAGVRVVSAARTLRGEIVAAKARLEPRPAGSADRGDETTPRAAYDRG
ncbi:hypothetical protein [Nonomuraea antimicrobica]|uniref:hypothetical protein n=1 Tax=Nonomuraea antimicrobica TaxID=561173 RepID=UPI0031E7A842